MKYNIIGDNMINYVIKNFDNKLFISKNYDCHIKDITVTKFFNELLLKQFSTFSAREKTIKKTFKFKSKIPVLINKELLFLNIRSHKANNSLYINFFSIYDYKETNKYIYLTFYNQHVMKIKEKYSFCEQIKRCETIVSSIRNQENVFI